MALAHELRTPLTSLLGYAQLLQRDDRVANPALLRDGLELIEGRALELSRIVRRLASYADPSVGRERADLAPATTELGQLIRAAAGPLPVRVELSAEAEHASIDRETLETIMRELLENAARHGQPDAEIRVRGTVMGHPRRLVLRVTNRGREIPSESRDSVFSPFGKAGVDYTQRDPGIGLGLAVARRLAELSGGHLVLEPGAPTTFRIELPLTTDPIADRLRALNEQAIHAEADALEAASLLDEMRGRAGHAELDPALATAHERQMRAVGEFRRLHRQAIELTQRLDRVYLEITSALARAVEARDEYTGSHVERVARHSVRIAQALGLSEDALRQIEFGGVLHDVGKIGVPDAVLGKAGALTAEEWEMIRRHPLLGRRVLQGIAFLGPALDAVMHHHERWDGGGYPFRLAGEEIPLAGRIVAVADAFDAMVTDRPYRRGLPTDVALGELERGREKAFDPEVVDAFLGTIKLAS